MFTDIEGYTALMQKSESSALDVRGRHREVFEHTHKKYQGKIVNYYGDGTLSIFDSVVNAVQCSIEMQGNFKANPVIPVRIGIHVGDIVITDDDIIGDAVNLASRYESLAVAGSVLVSEKVVEELKGHDNIRVKSLGQFHFKNDEKPRMVFAVSDPILTIPKRHEMKGKTIGTTSAPKSLLYYTGFAWASIQITSYLIESKNLDPGLLDLLIILSVFGLPAVLIYTSVRPRLAWKPILLYLLNITVALAVVVSYLLDPTWLEPKQLRVLNLFGSTKNIKTESLNSIGVLPFSNNSGDTDIDPLVAGMHFGLISEIGQLGNNRVISRTSMLPYANSGKSLQVIASELDVDAVVETSLTRVDSIIELRISLVKVAPEEELMWSHTFETQIGNMPNLYKEVTRNVASKINNMISPSEQQLLTESAPIDPEAYEAYLRGRYYAGFLTPEGFQRARTYFQKAIDRDPDYAAPYTGMALIWIAMKQVNLISPREADPNIRQLLSKAIQLDSMSAESWAGLGALEIWTDYHWASGEDALLRSIEINPNNSRVRATYAHYLMIRNRWEEAWDQMDYATEIDPQNPWVMALRGVMYGNEGKPLSAIRIMETLRKLVPDHPFVLLYLVNKYSNTFRDNLAIAEFKKVLKPLVGDQLDLLIAETFAKSGFRSAVVAAAEALEARRDSTFVSPFMMLQIYDKILNDTEKAVYWLTQMYHEHDPNVPYLGIRQLELPLQSDARIIKIMEDIGLW
jgi:TolB-like protein